MKRLILLGWFFITFYDGRVTKLEFMSRTACDQARETAVRFLRYVTPCIHDTINQP